MFDLLSLFFLFVIFIVSLPALIYSFSYLKGEYSAKQIFLAQVLLCVFILSMALVVTVTNLIAFLVSWEIMSLVSYLLVVSDGRNEKSVKAGMIYIVMTHIGTAFIIAAFLIMYKYANSFDFIVIKSISSTIPANTKNIIFLLLFFGFATKAGVVPMHIWLPYAHPQAPSHVSSIMSGVMIKTAIYGMIRFIMAILGVTSPSWGILIMIFAVISCLTGVIYALMVKDIKQVLAYSSIENIGIILLGLGLSMVFISFKFYYLAVFSLIASFYHLLNHAIFKGLLFLCAGGVYKATETRNIEKMGGLIKKMPQTALFCLIGAMAISALPPLNGFVSEWMTLQAFFLGAFNASGTMKLFLGICASMLALTGGLAAACFVRLFGITFLAKPRSNHANNAKEVSFSMRFAMFFLACLTIVFGIFAAKITGIISKIAAETAGVDATSMKFPFDSLSLTRGAGIWQISVPLLAFMLAVFTIAGFVIYRMFGAGQRIYKTWDCGYYKLGQRNEYTATAFSKPFRIAFNFFLLPYRRMNKIRESFYHVKTFAYETHTVPVFKRYIYSPFVIWVFKSAKFMRRIQPGSIHLYLGYIFVTLLALIIFVHKI